jgi:hypothetical protein
MGMEVISTKKYQAIIENRFQEMLDHIDDEYYIGLDKGIFRSYDVLVCGWVPDPQPNSTILDSATDIYNDFLTTARNVSDYITECCETLQEELESMVNNDFNSIEKYEDFEYVPFEVLDIGFESIPKFQLDMET